MGRAGSRRGAGAPATAATRLGARPLGGVLIGGVLTGAGATGRAPLGVATAAYLATCGVGLGVRTGVLRTERVRGVHHALFVVTAVSAGAAVLALGVAGHRPAAASLLASAVPFAALTRSSPRAGPHARLALAAAPAYAAAWLLRGAPRASARAASFRSKCRPGGSEQRIFRSPERAAGPRGRHVLHIGPVRGDSGCAPRASARSLRGAPRASARSLRGLPRASARREG
ncbi:hypothetical protein ABID92_002129 [Frigoribacterium sp. PvP120]|uniref:hypothetical protein n=1 Tax=unclassified Frigoribacterium TaxID=2627005 RepID=UPI001AE625E9|nr:hypothetical protein [Frigoribacterium sp. PvP121]MBP1240431.1 hypothetical protein [Frigoribacterium sp. PvP121]